jgi:hypothetical protein
MTQNTYREAQSTFRDEGGEYYWAKQSGHPQRSLIKMYIPEEIPLDGAKTTYGSKVFVYNAGEGTEQGVWIEQNG